MSEPERPDRLAWFAHLAAGRRHLGLFDPQVDGYLDAGPLDVIDALADGRLTDPAALRDACTPMDGEPHFAVPIDRPGKILCLGKNYAAHAAEFGASVPEEPFFFAKLQDTLLPHRAPIVLPAWVDSRIDHEIELALVLGFPDPERRGRKYVPPEAAMDLVAGYTILNDVTARRMQGDDRKLQHPWLRAKSFDTFCPIGPWVIPARELPDPHALRLRLHVGAELRQDSSTALLVVDIPHTIAFLSRHTTLRPGDIIATGTPEGVGPLAPGDVVRCWIEGIGTLENPVVREAPPG